MNNTIDGAATDIAKDLAALRRDVTNLAEAMRDLAQGQTRNAGLRLSDAVDSARTRIAGVGDEAQKRARATNTAFESSIETNPLTATAIALAAGLLIGWISKSRD